MKIIIKKRKKKRKKQKDKHEMTQDSMLESEP